MTQDRQGAGARDMLDVRDAAALVGRHPETVRRWVWSGRLAARRQGTRLFVERADVEAMVDERGTVIGLAEWAERAHKARDAVVANGPGCSAAELVLEDRAQRSQPVDARAGR